MLDGGRFDFFNDRYTDCDECVTACPIHATPRVQTRRLGDILELLRENVAFLMGISAPGREARMHLGVIRALFAAVGDGADHCQLIRSIDHLGAAGKQHELRQLTIHGKTDRATEIDGRVGPAKMRSTPVRVWRNGNRSGGVRGHAAD